MSLNANYLSNAIGTVAISDQELNALAPSVFASQPIAGVSDRYSFLPTSSILNGMRENGGPPSAQSSKAFAPKHDGVFRSI
jgi:hypothetical protein